jgi:hypothetical protein
LRDGPGIFCVTRACRTLRPKDLPSNREIRDQIQALANLYEGEKRQENLCKMRIAALHMMRLLCAFRPKLIGSTYTGHIRKGSDIDIHVFSDHPSAVTTVLEDERFPFTVERKRIIKQNEERTFTHVHVTGTFNFELTLYPLDKVNYAFKSLSRERRSRSDDRRAGRVDPLRAP